MPRPGCAVVFELADAGAPTLLAEWSREPSWRASAEQSLASGAVVDVRPLVDLLEEWRDAVLGERSLDRTGRKRLYPLLTERAEARRVLMAALGGQELVPLLDGLLDEGWSEAELHRLVDARPDPERLRELLER